MAVATLSLPSAPLVSPEQTAALLGVTIGTLAVWRCTRRYPLKWIKIGKCVRYRLSDIEAFIESRTVRTGDKILP